MHKVLNPDGSVKRVTMTAEAWRKLHSDFKGTGPKKTALVWDDTVGTTLAPVEITADGLPVEGDR